MARANLKVDGEVVKAFREAQADPSHTALIVRISSEKEAITLKKTIPRGEDESATDQFTRIAEACEGEAAFILWQQSGNNDNEAPWVLILFSPDETTPIKLKMLYASSVDDLRESLGSSLFAHNIQITSTDDLTWEVVNESISSDSKAVLSPAEQEIQSLATEENEARVTAVSPGSGGGGGGGGNASMKFQLLENAIQKIEDFKGGRAEVAFLSINDSEQVAGLPAPAGSSVIDAVKAVATAAESKQKPFYAVVKAPAHSSPVFLYYCPEDAPLKSKMTFSTAKAAVINAVSNLGLKDLKMIESRDVSDVCEELSEQDAYRAQLNEEVLTTIKPKVRGGRRLIRRSAK